MNKKLLVFVFLMTFVSALIAGEKTKLKFTSNKTFKIVQFTDIHWDPNSKDPWIPTDKTQQEFNYETMENILDIEKPNLVIITGDILFNRHNHNKEDLTNALKPIIDRKIPWAFVMGNHDHEYAKNTKEVISFLAKQPHSFTKPGPGDLGSSGNYTIKIYSSDNNKTSFILYMLDSNMDSPFKNKNGENDGYDFIHLNQINWYTNTSKKLTKENDNKPYPALMFFHIPIPEFRELWSNSKVYGAKLENECCPKLNSGLFTAARVAGDVFGIFVGHDHVNDYIGSLDGIALAYGRKTGLACYGPMPLEHGSRVIVLHEGEKIFDTWIRTRTGKKEDFVKFPDFFN